MRRAARRRLQGLSIDDLGKYRRFLGTIVDVVIDRPLGSRHPRHGFVYETNYGYLPDTHAGDGHEIDVYVLGVDEPVETYRGQVIALIQRNDDVEHKLIVAPAPLDRDEIYKRVAFVEHYYDVALELAE